MWCQIRDGQCPEYSGEEQAICAVGLAKCRPGVFVEAIQYLLVLATPVEVTLFQWCNLITTFFSFFLCVLYLISYKTLLLISWFLLECAALKDLMVEILMLKFQYNLCPTIQYHQMEWQWHALHVPIKGVFSWLDVMVTYMSCYIQLALAGINVVVKCALLQA